ncbi:3'-5' exonuclease [Pajaroellobacter abortibovis]|uniref:DNA polymerase III subunit epsilon n=1 Tax=Pajaroellobacter abortibovis TaxID=1882918 RepID=A0A1L6MV09_9BACT|nr:3'-5' exonuclease [Pajaroellobacter abortibovis]APR99326.1 DNA polymerase III subunit epsilon [Pajaroellobacter abortibovis]
MNKNLAFDTCGCFPTGRHYPGIAHLIQASVQGLAEEYAANVPWEECCIASIDVETTGRDASVDRIVEIGIVIGRNREIIHRYQWRVNPGCPIPEAARLVHGIGNDDVKDAPTLREIAAEIETALQNAIPVAYNASFDRSFLHHEFARIQSFQTTSAPALRHDVEWFDPLVWAREIQKEEHSRTLSEVAARLGVTLEKAHQACADAEAALRILYAFSQDPRVPKSYGLFVREQRRLSQEQADERRKWRSS